MIKCGVVHKEFEKRSQRYNRFNHQSPYETLPKVLPKVASNHYYPGLIAFWKYQSETMLMPTNHPYYGPNYWPTISDHNALSFDMVKICHKRKEKILKEEIVPANTWGIEPDNMKIENEPGDYRRMALIGSKWVFEIEKGDTIEYTCSPYVVDSEEGVQGGFKLERIDRFDIDTR